MAYLIQLNNISAMELNMIRPFCIQALHTFRTLATDEAQSLLAALPPPSIPDRPIASSSTGVAAAGRLSAGGADLDLKYDDGDDVGHAAKALEDSDTPMPQAALLGSSGDGVADSRNQAEAGADNPDDGSDSAATAAAADAGRASKLRRFRP